MSNQEWTNSTCGIMCACLVIPKDLALQAGHNTRDGVQAYHFIDCLQLTNAGVVN